MYFPGKDLVDFCSKLNITVEQFMLLYFLETNQIDLIYKYTSECRAIPTVLIEDLLKKKVIKKTSKVESEFPDHYTVTPKFANMLQQVLAEEADEFWRAFPHQIHSADGRWFNGRNVGQEEFELLYDKILTKAQVPHIVVFNALQEQIESNTVGMGMKKWLETHQWEREDNTVMFTNDI